MEQPLSPPASTPEWNPITRILFRITFAYLLLYNFPFPLNVIPFSEVITKPYYDLQHKLGVFVGKHVFHKDITVFTNGSGDTTYDYVLAFSLFVIALLAALLWTVLDRRRKHYARLFEWMHVYVRYVLAVTMISYGAVKIIPEQFPRPALDRLLQPYGDSSPMGLLWTFMGASVAFNIFTGLGEAIGGLLLAWRRTTLLGAMVLVAVLSNVVVLNYSYDVPVKLYSSHLLAMVFFLLLPSLQRLLSFLLLNRQIEPVTFPPHIANAKLNRWLPLLGSLLVVAFLGWQLYDAQQGRKQFGNLAPKSPLYGIWNVEELELDGTAQPALLTNETRWRRVIFDFPQMVAVQLMNDSRQRYGLKLDAEKKTLELMKRDDPNWKATLSYDRSALDQLTLEGTFEGKKLRARLQRKDPNQFLLVNRGFHWINEFPFNR